MKNEKDLLKGLKELNSASRFISDKFLDADRRKWKNPKDLELFIVEGDSAGGHFKQARESFQGELKLRGKPINAQSKKPEDLFGVIILTLASDIERLLNFKYERR